MCSMARRKLGYIYRRFYKCSYDSSTLLILYKAFIRPILEYGAPVWDPYLIKDIQAIESIQRFATKICAKNWSMPYPDQLQLLNLDSLFTRRKCAKLCLLYKTVHSLSAPSFSLIPLIIVIPPDLTTLVSVHSMHTPTMLSILSLIALLEHGINCLRKLLVVTHSQHLRNHFLNIMSFQISFQFINFSLFPVLN